VKELAKVTKADVLRVADVARLNLSDDEAEMYSTQLSAILSFTEKINEINTDDVKPTTNGNELTNVLRDDVAVEWPHREAVLENAPEHEDNQFKVPTIIE